MCVEKVKNDSTDIYMIQGARWDEQAACLDEARPKQLLCPMPVLLLKAVALPEDGHGGHEVGDLYRYQNVSHLSFSARSTYRVCGRVCVCEFKKV